MNVKAKALAAAMVTTQPEVKVETLIETLGKVKAAALVNALT